MTDESDYAQFQQELAVLLLKYGVSSYLLGVVMHAKEKDETQIPVCFNITGNRAKNLTVARTASAFVHEILASCLRVLMRFCGLSLSQALGAVREGAESAAAEIQAERSALASFNDVDGGGT